MVNAVLNEKERIQIKHHNDSEWVDLNVYPSSVTNQDNVVSISYNNMYGEFQDTPVNKKRKMVWKFDAIEESELLGLYDNFILAKLLQYNSRYFDIKGKYMGTNLGANGSTFYLGTPTTFNLLGAPDDRVYSGELSWIETKGTRLAGPTTPPSGN